MFRSLKKRINRLFLKKKSINCRTGFNRKLKFGTPAPFVSSSRALAWPALSPRTAGNWGGEGEAVILSTFLTGKRGLGRVGYLPRLLSVYGEAEIRRE